MTEQEARGIVCRAGKRMVESGFVAGTWGNISQRVDENTMVITPSGMDYFRLGPDDMVLVDLKTEKPCGRWKPSIETPLHAAILRARPYVNAVIHTHSTYACVVAAARKEIPPILDDMVQIIGGSVRVADYALPGSDRLVEGAIQALEGRNAVILANHGPVALGREMDEAFTVCQVLEKAALAFMMAQLLGGAIALDDADVAFMRGFFLEKYGQR